MSDQSLAAVPTTGGALSLGNPQAITANATAVANELAKVIRSRSLSSNIQGKHYVQVEGWQTLATLMGCMPFEVSNEGPDEDGVYVAVVEIRRMADGMVLSRASAECGAPDELNRKGEPIWAHRPRYARRSMAATRATSKACRVAFSWVMVLAGYEATPAEEVPPEGFEDAPPPIQTPQRRGGGGSVKEGQVRTLRSKLERAGVEENALCAAFELGSIEELPANRINDALDWIDGATA